MTTKSDNGILGIAEHNFLQTAKRLKLSEQMRDRLLLPEEKIEMTLRPTMPDGKTFQIKAFIVRHSDAIGPAKGGIRLSKDVNMMDVEGLAMEMAWKTSLIGVPFGGGKSGICFDTAFLNRGEKEVLVRSFTRKAMRYISPELYIPAPDMGTNETDMGHIRDCLSYSSGKSITNGCFVTGKPQILGGIVGRREATGRGVVYSVVAACQKTGLELSGARIAVQGFGNVGKAAVEIISKEYGAKVVAISDIDVCLKNPEGIDVDKLVEYSTANGQIKGFPDAEELPRDSVITADCDILIPAATQAQITLENCDQIKASIIAEGANAPTVPEADQKLIDRGVLIIPDILCNAGGVFVSYLEYTQETQREQMTYTQVKQRLKDRISETYQLVNDYAQTNNIDLRSASMDMAVSRVVQSIEARGFLP